MSTLTKIQTEKAPKALGPYSQAIKAVNPGALVFVSGQLPIDLETEKIAQGDIRVLTNKIFDHIEAILAASNCTLQDVVRMDVFLKDLKDFAPMNEEYGKRLGGKNAPARQTIQVADLPLGAPIEISCIAVSS